MNDAMTFAMDPDVYSLAGEVQPWMEEVEAQNFELMTDDIPSPPPSDAASVTHEEEPVDPLAVFKKPQGLVRDGTFIESRVRCLYITSDNCPHFLWGLRQSKKGYDICKIYPGGVESTVCCP
jgi:hypothetical protein